MCRPFFFAFTTISNYLMITTKTDVLPVESRPKKRRVIDESAMELASAYTAIDREERPATRNQMSIPFSALIYNYMKTTCPSQETLVPTNGTFVAQCRFWFCSLQAHQNVPLLSLCKHKLPLRLAFSQLMIAS